MVSTQLQLDVGLANKVSMSIPLSHCQESSSIVSLTTIGEVLDFNDISSYALLSTGRKPVYLLISHCQESSSIVSLTTTGEVLVSMT